MASRQLQQVGDEYRRHGVARLAQFFSAERIDEIRRELDHYGRNVLPDCPADARTLEADGKTIRNLWRLEQHSDYFRRLADCVEIHELSLELLESQPVLKGIETFNKPARIGSGVPWHQDNAYFCRTPPDMFTLWIAIDPVTVENGAVSFLRGSHRNGVLSTRPSGVKGNSIGLAEPPDVASADVFCATLNPGDATVHHCNTIHYSEPNRSSQPRLALLFVFCGADTRVDPDLQAAYTAAVTANPPA